MESGAVRSPVWKTVLAFAGDVLVVLLLTVATLVVWSLFTETITPDAQQRPVQSFLFIGSFSIVPLLWVWRCWPALSVPARESLPISLAWGVGAGFLGFFISCSMDWLARWTGSEMPVASSVELMEQLFAASTLLALIDLVVLAPVAEELLFRKLLMGRFIKAGSQYWGIVLTSLLFAFMHEPFPTQDQTLHGWLLLFLDYFLAGVLFAGVYVRTGRLSAAIAAHATNNLIVCLHYLTITP